MLIVVLVLAGLAVGVPLGIYGRWSGWGFGLGWWGRPTPVEVRKVTPLAGARLTGHSERALVERAHRVLLDLFVDAEPPYEASTISWQEAGDHLGGKRLVARISRTRPKRVFVPRDAVEAEEQEGVF